MRRGGRRLAVCALLAPLVVLGSCRTAPPSPTGPVEAGLRVLRRPLPGDLAALYRMRVPRTGGLRLSVLASGTAGRMTVAEPFGSTVSLLAWDGPGRAVLLDLRSGCRREVGDASEVLGLPGLPLPQAVLLLGGRLPALPGDRVVPEGEGPVRIEGNGFAFRARLAADPWRVVEVEGPGSPPAWRLTLGAHTVSVPREIHAETRTGRRLELTLVRLEWDTVEQLPPLPELPPCGGGPARPGHDLGASEGPDASGTAPE